MRMHTPRTRPIARYCASMMAAVLAFVGLVVLAGPAAAATNYYVDCSRTSNGTGTEANPFNSLTAVSNRTFSAGDSVLFKRGTTCTGKVQLKGSGTSSARITAGAYGTGAKPKINGNGADTAILLLNVSNWVVRDLEVTNPASSLARRNGILIHVTDGTRKDNIEIRDVYVHDVAGQTNKSTHATDFSHSAGIMSLAENSGSRIFGLYVHHNVVEHTGGGGIKLRAGLQLGTWGGSVRAEYNTVNRAGGDGIIVQASDSPMIQRNTVTYLGWGNYPWTGGNFAGIWVLSTHNATMQYNVVTDSRMSAADSQAFDCDWGNTGTCLVQYNYSRDNAGGLFLNCDGCGTSGGATHVVRYNISENDCRMSANGSRSPLKFYNNVFYCTDKKFDVTWSPTTEVVNNIFVGLSTSTLPTGSGVDYRWNVFQGVPKPTSNGVQGDPLFTNPNQGGTTLSAGNGYRLRVGSPALGNGEVISGNGGQDYFGNAVSSTAKPNRGAYNGSPL